MELSIGRRIEEFQPRRSGIHTQAGVADEENIFGIRRKGSRALEAVSEKLLR